MKRVKVYQTDNYKYRFMNWNWSEKYFNLNDYTLVAEFNAEDNESDLEAIYRMGNDGTIQQVFRKMRSISVSDIIEIDGTKYYVDSFGFREI